MKLSQKQKDYTSNFMLNGSTERMLNPDTCISEKFQKPETEISAVRSANVEEALRVFHSNQEAQQESKWRMSIKKHKKADAKVADKQLLVMPRKDDVKLVQEDALVISNAQPMRPKTPLLETSLRPPVHNVPAPATELPIVRVIQQEWVCCDNCEKWRLLPPGVGSAQLPETWTCKLLYWLPGLNKCKVPEEITNQAVEPYYDVSHFQQSREPISFVLQNCGRSQDNKRRRTELSNKISPCPGMEENQPLRTSIRTTLSAKSKKLLTGANKTFTEKGILIDMKVKKKSLIEIEKMVNVEDTEKANCLEENNGLDYGPFSHGIISSEATKVEQQAEQATCTIDDNALDTYMKAAVRFLQAAALIQSCGAKSGNEELLVNIYIEAAILTKLCSDAYEMSAELASAMLAHKCMASANLNLVHLIGSDILCDADKLHFLQRQDTPGGNIVISPEVCPSYEHLMHYVDFTNAAMDSVKKSMILFTTIRETLSLSADVFVALERVFDFDLQNVGGLMQVVLEAMELLKNYRTLFT